MMTTLIVLAGLSICSTLFILCALVAAKRNTPDFDISASARSTASHTPSMETAAALVSSVRLAA
jgi:hypothetical protein